VSTENRALQSRGTSSDWIQNRIVEVLRQSGASGERVVDVACGTGSLAARLAPLFKEYVGVDVVKHEGFPKEANFVRADLDKGPIPLPDGTADAAVAVESIEHVENPRAFMRELVRLARPGGWVAISTPNQLSLLSKLTLVLKNQFNAFQAGDYPAHITALLEEDLRRMAKECGLTEVAVEYTRQGRVIFTPWSYPPSLSRLLPRAFSDNVILIARKPSNR
jgi:2-polyprenyl-3-methyl-5-hydroxy-6-metoxy-1,4-benzoquinol methylase